jgi:hypothetical protein
VRVPAPASDAPSSTLSSALQTALTRSGALGATVKQLAHTVAEPPEHVAAALDTLAHQGDVERIGRGLWILRDFSDLAGRADFDDPASFAERFAREDGISLGQYTGPITFRSNETTPVHRWWPYVQGYSAEFVRGTLERADLDPRSVVLDPFAGSGTSLVEARLFGTRAWGAELLAPAVLAARVKTAFELSPARLRTGGARVLAAARHRPSGRLPFLTETRRQFSPRNLATLTQLRDALPAEGTPLADALRVAFGRILIPSSHLHRSPCLGYRRGTSHEPGEPLALFGTAIEEMATDLEQLRDSRAHWGAPARVDRVDARRATWPAGSVTLAVTSPPYVNGMDYVMNYKVDLAWLGYARSYADLAALRAAEVACDNLPRSETAPYGGVEGTPDPWLTEILPRIRENVARKGSYRRDDMHAVVHRYFADLEPVLRAVYRALLPGGRFVLVVGDSLLAGAYVPGDLILARMGARLGFSVVSVEVARTRRSGQRRSFVLRESVVTLERRRSTG